MSSPISGSDDWPVDETYSPDQDRSLSEAVLAAIAEYKDVDLTRSGFTLYESVDPDALDSLFRHDASPETVVDFAVDDVRVRCWGDGDVRIQVRGTDDANE